jgi:MFS family permease
MPVGESRQPAMLARGRNLPAAIFQFPLFDALHHRNYRLLWVGQGSTSMGMWMDQVARSWLLYQLTSSPLQLGLLQGLQALPILFLSPIAGTAADRYDRKLLMGIASIFDTLRHCLVAVLIVTGHIQPWHVYATAFAGSVSSTFHQPPRSAMIADAVPPHHLSNAYALTSVFFNISRSAGPAAAGLLIAAFGTAGSYVAQSLLYVLSLLVTVLLPASLRYPAGPGAHHTRSHSFGRSILEGWKVSWSNETVRASLLMVTSASIFVLPFTTLLPVFARDILNVGASGQGFLLTAMGIGALCSSVVIASMADRLPRGMLMLGGVVCYGLAVLAFSASPWFPLSVALMVVVGLFHVTTHTLAQIVVQAYTPPEFRGRTMAILGQTHMFQLLGGMALGGVASLLGAPWAITTMAGVGALASLAIFVLVPVARRIR